LINFARVGQKPVPEEAALARGRKVTRHWTGNGVHVKRYE
jgi:hypothetical protein